MKTFTRILTHEIYTRINVVAGKHILLKCHLTVRYLINQAFGVF